MNTEFIRWNGRSTEYFIPPEWSHKDLITCRNEIKVKKGEGGWVRTCFLEYYLNQLGYSVQQYYNKWILGKDLNYTHICSNENCPNGNPPTSFFGISKGYASFCSQSCARSYIINHEEIYGLTGLKLNWKNPETSKLLLDNLHYMSEHKINGFRTADENIYSYISIAKCAKHRFITESEGAEKAYLYINEFTNKVKIGITLEYDLTYGRFDKRIDYSDLSNVKIYLGNPKSVSEVEYRLKITNFNNLDKCMMTNGYHGYTEFFDLSVYDSFINYCNIKLTPLSDQ